MGMSVNQNLTPRAKVDCRRFRHGAQTAKQPIYQVVDGVQVMDLTTAKAAILIFVLVQSIVRPEIEDSGW